MSMGSRFASVFALHATRAVPSSQSPILAAIRPSRVRAFSSAGSPADLLVDLRDAAKIRNLWEVNRLYDALRSDPSNLRSLTPDDVGTLLSLHLKAASSERVNGLLEDVSSAGIRPALGEYNTYVEKNASGDAWCASDAKVFLDAMRRRGVKPDAETYRHLSAALISRGDAVGAKSLLDTELPTDGVVPDAVMYTSLIRGLAAIGDVEAAAEVVDDMLDADVRPDGKLLQQTVEELMKRGLNDVALDLVNELAVDKGGEAVVEMGSGGSRP